MTQAGARGSVTRIRVGPPPRCCRTGRPPGDDRTAMPPGSDRLPGGPAARSRSVMSCAAAARCAATNMPRPLESRWVTARMSTARRWRTSDRAARRKRLDRHRPISTAERRGSLRVEGRTGFHLDELTELVEGSPEAFRLYVRWSRGPAVDLSDDGSGAASSRDSLTGVPLPGLSANPLAVEPWWDGRCGCGWPAGCTTIDILAAPAGRTCGPGF
jgi:hypothetical protein